MCLETGDRRRNMPIRVLLARMHHDTCGGRPARVELMSGSMELRPGRCGGQVEAQ
jgi:hypothetical protein